MASRRVTHTCFLLLFVMFVTSAKSAKQVPFDANYGVYYGEDRVDVLNQGRQVQLSMDSGAGYPTFMGSGFISKQSYGSGCFGMRIKLHEQDTAGVVTTFHLTSDPDTDNHDEIAFEFLGNVQGEPITLQTNVIANGHGDKQQRINLWFDPRREFHSYKILWNQQIIIFYVDDIVIRVFHNNTELGVAFPKKAMQVRATIQDGSNWSMEGAGIRVNWSHEPFTASYEDFSIDGCPAAGDGEDCSGSNYWWNGDEYLEVSRAEHKQYQQMREKYMNYDYCKDRNKYPRVPLECAFNYLMHTISSERDGSSSVKTY